MVKLKGPKDATAVVFDGKEYPAKNGTVEVPDEAVALLVNGKHGWKIAQPEKAEK